MRASCVLAGLAVLLSVLASMPGYHNNMVFAGLMLILAGLYEEQLGLRILQFQALMVYFGAGLNKLTDPDWRSGQFFLRWFEELDGHTWWLRIEHAYPAVHLSRLASWSVIFTELAFVPALLFRLSRRVAIVAAVLFHTGMLAMTDNTFGVFYYAMCAAMLLFVDWPDPPFSIRSRWLGDVFARNRRLLDPDAIFCIAPADPGEQLQRALADLKCLLWWPLPYFAWVLLFKVSNILHVRRYVVLLLLGLAAAVPVAAWFRRKQSATSAPAQVRAG